MGRLGAADQNERFDFSQELARRLAADNGAMDAIEHFERRVLASPLDRRYFKRSEQRMERLFEQRRLEQAEASPQPATASQRYVDEMLAATARKPPWHRRLAKRLRL